MLTIDQPLLFTLSTSFVGVLNCLYAIEIFSLSRSRSIYLLMGHECVLTHFYKLFAGLVLLCSIFLIVLPKSSPIIFVTCLVLLISGEVLFQIFKYGYDGADHVRIFLNYFVTIASLLNILNISWWQDVYFILVTALAIGFYFGAFIAKIISVSWRNGNAIAEAFSTYSFGNFQVYKFFTKHKCKSIVISWVVMMWELALPLSIFSGNITIVNKFLAFGILFHATIAITMRLPLFFIASMAMYPAIYWVTNNLPI